jgi:glycosyltransferase involved in cell wall biosynthesis
VPENQQWTLNCCNRNEVLFIGRFDKHKGGDLIVDAFTKLAAQYHDASLSFVGPDLGVKENNRMLSLDEYLDKNVPDSIRSKITYLGQLSRREVDELRPKAYMTVVSSRYENFGNVVLEAMAFGCPLVATSVGGTAEIVRDGYDGLLSAPNADALANQMKMIFEDTELAERISKQAVLSISNRFNPNKQARQTADFFREVLQK